MSEEKAYLSLWVTKSFKQQIEHLSDSERLTESLIKEHLEKRVEFIRDEIKGIDDITLLYRSKLVDIRDNFGKALDIYNEELDKLGDSAGVHLDKFHDKFKTLRLDIESIDKQGRALFDVIKHLSDKVSYINVERIEKLLDQIDRFNKLSDEEKRLVSLLIINK